MTENRVTSSDYTKEYYQLDLCRYQTKNDFYEKRVNRVLPCLDVKSHDTIVDLGCGVGTFAIEVAKKAKLVYAIDYSQPALDIVEEIIKQRGITNIITLKNSATSTQLASESVDKIVLADLVEHLYYEQFIKAIRESNRILKPNGLVCIYTPNPPSMVKRVLKVFYGPLKQAIENWRMSHKDISEYDKEHGQKYEYLHVDYKQPEKIKKVLCSYGFVLVKEAYFETPGPDILKFIPYFARTFGGRSLLVAVKKIEDVQAY